MRSNTFVTYLVTSVGSKIMKLFKSVIYAGFVVKVFPSLKYTYYNQIQLFLNKSFKLDFKAKNYLMLPSKFE